MHKITTGAILARTASLLAMAPLASALAFAALFLPWLANDLVYDGDNPAVMLAASILSFAAQYSFTAALLRRLDLLRNPRKGRVASYLLVGILTGLGILLGLVLLIVPGLWLLARWSIVTPLVIGEGLHTHDAIEHSGKRTTGSIVAIALALVILFVPMAIGLGLFSAVGEGWLTLPATALATVTNLLDAVSLLATWTAVVAIYELSLPR
jgi:hypothetical protein